MTGSLKVNTDELRNVGSVFAAAGEKLAGVQAEAPLADVASAVPQLRTASACISAKSIVANAMSAIVTEARTYGANLSSAAGQYESADHVSGGNIAGVDGPAPVS